MDVQESLDFIVQHMATKDDIRDMATKSDIKDMATKSDIKDMATKSDIREIKITLADHTRQLSTIQNDLDIMRDKRLQLEVRTDAVEKYLGIKPPMGTVSR